jgi:plasmid stabilization system protein ParE
MRVVFTDEALHDLDEILTFVAAHYPTIVSPFQQRLRTVLRRIGSWPKSAEEVEQRPGVRMVPLVRFPYKVFYQVTGDAVEILHVHHAARQPPWSNPQGD